jgi:hypothetical protein
MDHFRIQECLELTVKFLFLARRCSSCTIIPLVVAESYPDPLGNKFGRPLCITYGLGGTERAPEKKYSGKIYNCAFVFKKSDNIKKGKANKWKNGYRYTGGRMDDRE